VVATGVSATTGTGDAACSQTIFGNFVVVSVFTAGLSFVYFFAVFQTD